MSHANARLTPAGRLTMVQRVAAGGPIVHVAAGMGGLRTACVAVVAPVPRRWPGGPGRPVERDAQPPPPHSGLRGDPRADREDADPSRTGHDQPSRRAAALHHRAGPRPAGHPRPVDCNPVTGHVIRASRRSANRYEHQHPGSLAHIDVHLLGRIPDGGGWRTHGRSEEVRGFGIEYDYVDTAVDGHSHLAYARDTHEKGASVAGYLARAAAFYAGHGIRIERVISDNAFADRNSLVFHNTAADCASTRKLIRSHRPWACGKIVKLNRTLPTEWAYSPIWSPNGHGAEALPAWLQHYNLERPHLGIGGLAPIDRVNNAVDQYT